MNSDLKELKTKFSEVDSTLAKLNTFYEKNLKTLNAKGLREELDEIYTQIESKATILELKKLKPIISNI